MALDFNDYPFLTGPPEYRVYEIAHLCPLGLPNGEHLFEECGGYCVNMLVGLEEVEWGEEERETGVYEVHLDSSEEPDTSLLWTEQREVAEEFVRWIEDGFASSASGDSR